MDLQASDLAQRYERDGFVIVQDSGFLDEIDVDAMWDELALQYPGRLDRVQDAWQTSETVRRIATHPLVLDTLRALYGRAPIPFQTLNFVTGTEQATHSDSIHFSCFPARFMCGVWVALEDITLAQGPLHYYEGSQVLPEFDYEDLGIPAVAGKPGWDNAAAHHSYVQYEREIARIAATGGFRRRQLAVKKGDFLVWSSNLLHGGDPHIDKVQTRKSQVSHYYFENTVRYTPMFSSKSRKHYMVRNVVDVRTGEPVPNMLDGEPVLAIAVDDVRSEILRASEAYDPDLAAAYLERYPDVRAHCAKPEHAYEHFVRHGAAEGRRYFRT